jgi:hypothetical protein
MRIVDLGLNAPKRRITVMSYGASRGGKTRFAGSFPRPLFLSDNSEGGWETLRHMNRDDWYESDVPPKVWAMQKAEDMIKAVVDIDQICKGPSHTVNGKVYKPGDIQTVVIDSLTFYADSYLTSLERSVKDKRQVYQALNGHLREVMVRVHELPVNVIWICLEKAPDEDNPGTGGILVAGQTRDKAPARCDYWLYHRSFQRGQELAFEVRTKKYGVWPAGGRDEGALPDPLPETNYRSMAEALGLISGAGHYTAEEMAEKASAASASAQQNQPQAPAPVQSNPAPANGGPVQRSPQIVNRGPATGRPVNR